MNAKELYLTIGQISDDLILDADTEHGKKKKPTIRFWAIATAACFCLMLGSGYLHFFGTSAVWNTGTIEFVSKVSIPENSTISRRRMRWVICPEYRQTLKFTHMHRAECSMTAMSSTMKVKTATRT